MAERGRVEIDSIAAGGDGVGRVDGLVVFVPRSVPGDVAEVEYETRGRMARGRLVSLERPSPDRVAPVCPHYTSDRCGGCQLQHISYGAQLVAKGTIVADALTRIGRREVAPPEVEPSGHPWRYRRKLTMALRRRGDAWIAGLHPYDAPGRVFELRDCHITDQRVLAVWRDIMAAQRLLPVAPALRGAVRLLDDGAAFTLEGGARWPTSQRFFDRLPSIAALWWEPGKGRRRLLHDRRSTSAPGASFAQVNPTVAAALASYLRERVLAHSPATVIDAYAGAGDGAVALAAEGVVVTAVELDAEAAEWAGSRLPAPSRSVAARVEDVLADLLPSDVVIVNPPRSGVAEGVTDALNARPPRALFYVSCNPATLARDLGRLHGFAIASLRSFDMFPQTSHVETVCELIPEAA